MHQHVGGRYIEAARKKKYDGATKNKKVDTKAGRQQSTMCCKAIILFSSMWFLVSNTKLAVLYQNSSTEVVVVE